MNRFVAALLGLVLGCRSIPGPEAAAPPLPPARADVHVHLTTQEAVSLFDGLPDGSALAASPDAQWRNQITSASLRAAGVGLVVGTVWPPFPLRPRQNALSTALRQLERLEHFCAATPAFAWAPSLAQARRAMQVGRIAVIPAVEGVEGIREVDDVDRLYAAGARSLGLVHFTDNALAGAEVGQFGPLSSVLADEGQGLTTLGLAAVHRMVALGILIDLSHASDRTIDDVLRVTTPLGVPVLFSHAGSAFARPRGLPDELATRIAAAGGLIGIGVYRSDFLKPIPGAEHWSAYEAGTCDDVVAHWVHYAQLVGPQHVVLGSDFNSPILRGKPGGSCPHGVRNTGDLPTLFEALRQRGVPQASLDDSAARVLALFEQVEAKASPVARAAAVGRSVPRRAPFDTGL